MFERYTEKARRVIFFSRHEAVQLGSPKIDTEHLLLGLLREDSGIAKRLSRPTLTIDVIRRRIEELKPTGEKGSMSGDMLLTDAAKRALIYAAEEADHLQDPYIGTNHIFLGLLAEKDGIAAQVLAEIVGNTSGLRDQVCQMSDASRKVALPQEIKQEDYIEIHGELWGAQSVREMAHYYGRFHWERRRYVARDALVQRSSRKLYLYLGQQFDPAEFELAKGEWNEDHCVICWWQICAADSPLHGEGYTNGQDWLCAECHDRFFNPQSQPAP